MVHSCCVLGCKSIYGRSKSKGVTYHEFPCRDEFRSQWIANIRRSNWAPSDRTKICSDHFEKCSFKDNLKVRRLKKNAVPTIFSTNDPSHPRKGIQTKTKKTTRRKLATSGLLSPSKISKQENIMEVNHSKEPAVEDDQPRKESEIHFTNNQVNVKYVPEYEAHPFEIECSEVEATIKVENYAENDGDAWASIVKSELVEFHNSDEAADPSYGNDLPTNNMLENILKTNKTETQVSFSPQKYDPYNTSTFSSSDSSDAEPERDPFADVDCDQNFNQSPPNHNRNNYSATKVQLINTASVTDSSNPSSSSGKIHVSSPVTTVTKDQNFERQTSYYTLQCHLCLKTQSSERQLGPHLEMCAASHKNRHRFCVLCNKLYAFPQGYRRHARQVHGIDIFELSRYPLKSKCDPCPSVFVQE